MPRSFFRCLIFLCLLQLARPLRAELSVDRLLPESTCGVIVLPDSRQLDERWQRTELAQLIADPAMRPFVDDIKGQFRAKLAETGVQLGVRLSDLAEIVEGEAAMAVVPQASSGPAMALLAHVGGRGAAAEQLVARVAAAHPGSTTTSVDGHQVTQVRLAGAADGSRMAYYFVGDGMFVVSDQRAVMTSILQRFANRGTCLADLPAYRETMARLAGDQAPQIRWFIDPLGYLGATACADSHLAETVAMLRRQGFDGIKAVGGHVMLSTGEHEILHRTYVYVPGGPERLVGAARILDFPNAAQLVDPLPWINATASNHLTINCRIQRAFEAAKGLVNDIAGDEVFEAMLENIATDPEGPRVDIRKDLIAHFGTRVTVVSDRIQPVGPDSERLLIAIELKNPDAIRRTVARGLSVDAQIRRHKIAECDVFEYQRAEEELVGRLQIEPVGAGFTTSDEPAPLGRQDLLPNAAVAVAHGHLLVATHFDYLQHILTQPAVRTLDTDADFVRMSAALERLGGGLDCARMHTRLADICESTYEMIRTGRMPESRSLLGLALNLASGSAEGQRAQRIDGSQLPPFAQIAGRLGLAGTLVQTERQGWLITGCVLPSGN